MVKPGMPHLFSYYEQKMAHSDIFFDHMTCSDIKKLWEKIQQSQIYYSNVKSVGNMKNYSPYIKIHIDCMRERIFPTN